MLVELSIKDFAIIDSLRLTVGPGLNIFTGETGAGKSIIMDAISLILGERASNGLIRASAEEAQVEAMFDVAGNTSLDGILAEAGIPALDELVIKRVVQKAGRNRIYINGSLATLMTLTELGRRLIDVYGQSEHQSLTRQEEHIEILDSFAGIEKLREYMASSWREYVALKKELESLLQSTRDISERRDLLSYQSKEIADAALAPGEEDELKRLGERLKNAGKIKAVTTQAEGALYSEPGSIVERLGAITKALKDLSSVDANLKKTAEDLEGALFQLEDASGFLRDYGDTVEDDPESIESVGARLDLIAKLKKKYGPTIEEILERKASMDRELSGLDDFEGRSKALAARVAEAKEKAARAALSLTEARTAAARELEKKIEEELSTLGMKGAVFEVSIETEKAPDGTPRLGEKGSERVSFFIATNRGEGLKPLARIASGGELSRIMLAMKSVSAVGRVPSLIFDEIDTGVSGAMAQVVGAKLKDVSLRHQVLCITHSPQIAAFADRHFEVAKKTSGGRTMTAVTGLEKEGRMEAISRMLGGLQVTDTTRKQALELMDAAELMASRKGQSRKRRTVD